VSPKTSSDKKKMMFPKIQGRRRRTGSLHQAPEKGEVYAGTRVKGGDEKPVFPSKKRHERGWT